MPITTSFRLTSAALIVLALPGLAPALSRCAGQEPGPRDPARDTRLMADRKAALRVIAVKVRAWALVLRDPDEAYTLLKDVRDAIREDPEISELCRESLQASLERALWNAIERGYWVKEWQAEQLMFRSELRARLSAWQLEVRRVWAQLGLSRGPE